MKPIDLRSDTVTRPSAGMLEAMMRAPVGDDVYGEDPTVNALQERVSSLFGKEAGLFMASGTMSNQVAIKSHTEPGDEVIAEEDAHIFVYETAAPALLSGVQMKTIPGVRGMLTPEQVLEAIRPATYYMPKTKLLCLENTHGRSAGAVLPIEGIKALSACARANDIRFHLDGARIWNAAVASGRTFAEYGALFDTLSVCFSKGLGTPVGSMLLGERAFIERARHFRKIFGGGMRQAGILAAAAAYALDHNVARLADDHVNARWLAESLVGVKGLQMDMASIQTNMVIMDVAQSGRSQDAILAALASRGVLLTPERRTSIRAVTHLDITRADVERASAAIREVFAA
jgi:threonine aldolase